MQPGQVNLLNSGVWLIPLILFATIGGLYLLVRYWREKTAQEMKALRSELRRSQSRRREIEALLGEYQHHEHEPYLSRLRTLQQELAQIDSQQLNLEQRRVGIQERTRRLAANRWRAAVGAPFFWYVLRQDSKALWDEAEALRQSLEAAEGDAVQLPRLAWEVAQQARQVQATQGQVRRLLDAFRKRGVRGDQMDAIQRQAAQQQAALDRLPSHLLNAQEETVLQQTGQDSVVEAHALLEQVHPQLQALQGQLEEFEKKYGETVERVAQMRRLVDPLEEALSQPPAGLDLDQAKAQFQSLKVIASNLNTTLGRLELESLDEVGREAERVRKTLEEMRAEIQAARQQHGELLQTIGELGGGVKNLSSRFAALASHPHLPLQWGQSTSELAQLSRQTNLLGPAQKPRTPQEISHDLERARKLNERQRSLTARWQAYDQKHSELITLLQIPELAQRGEWSQKARKLVERLKDYDPENWPRADAVPSLPAELRALEEGFRRLVPDGAPQPVPEESLGQRLEETRQLLARYDVLRGRVENIGGRLSEIQSAEQQARDNLDAARVGLGQIGILARSNPLLAEIATQEVGRLLSSVESLSAELEQPGRGVVEKKARAASALNARVEQSASAWLETFTKKLEAQKMDLGARLNELEAIAQFDEPAVAEAHRVLAESQTVPGGPARRTRSSLEEVLLDLKRRSDLSQSCSAALRALEDLARPVVDMHRSASQNRQYTREQFNELAAWMRGARAWPPTSLSLENERQELARAENAWEGLKGQPHKAINLVAQLANLANQYYSLSEKLRQIAEKAAAEQEKVDDLDGSLDDLAEQWRTQWQSYKDNPMTGEEIRKLLDDIERERGGIKRRYRQGSLSYSQVLQELEGLFRRLRTAQVPIDDSRVIDVSGRVIPYR